MEAASSADRGGIDRQESPVCVQLPWL